MKFVNQNGFTMEVGSVCENLFRRQGWSPVVDELIEDKTVEVTEETDENGQDESGVNSTDVHKKINFTTLSKEKIIEMAEGLGYRIAATKKADMIVEFMTQHENK